MYGSTNLETNFTLNGRGWRQVEKERIGDISVIAHSLSRLNIE